MGLTTGYSHSVHNPRWRVEQAAKSPRSDSMLFQMWDNTNRTWLQRAWIWISILPNYLYNHQQLCPLTACSEVRPSKLPPPEDPTKRSCSFFMDLERHNPLQFLFRTHIYTSHNFIVWIWSKVLDFVSLHVLWGLGPQHSSFLAPSLPQGGACRIHPIESLRD